MLITAILGAFSILAVRDVLGLTFSLFNIPDSVLPLLWVVLIAGASIGFLYLPQIAQLAIAIFGIGGVLHSIVNLLNRPQVIRR